MFFIRTLGASFFILFSFSFGTFFDADVGPKFVTDLWASDEVVPPPRTPRTPESPQTPRTPQTPQTSQIPRTPQTPQTPASHSSGPGTPVGPFLRRNSPPPTPQGNRRAVIEADEANSSPSRVRRRLEMTGSPEASPDRSGHADATDGTDVDEDIRRYPEYVRQAKRERKAEIESRTQPVNQRQCGEENSNCSAAERKSGDPDEPLSRSEETYYRLGGRNR